MPTFSAVVLKHHVKPDKTVRVKIRVTHHRESKYLDSGYTLTTSDLTKKFTIKTPAFIDATNLLIKSYRDKCNRDPAKIDRMNVAELITFLSSPDSVTEGGLLDFIIFGRGEIERLRAAGRKGVAKNYYTALNALERFIGGGSLPVSNITVKFLRGFEEFIRDNSMNKTTKGQSRAPSLYLGIVRALHNKMKLEYNDDETGDIPIPYTPFAKYKLPQEKPTRKRALSPETVKAIVSLPDKGPRYNLARDCFTLSFCLIGMNSADLFYCPPVKQGSITYKRKKTSTRRRDEALISVVVQPEIIELIKKYKDKSGKAAFDFYQRYSTAEGLNQAINKGLKQIGKELKIEDLEYYAARHSWATIALNRCGVDKYTVHAALNHVDESMRVTDIYIEKDWSLINEANRRVLDYTLTMQKV